MNPNDALKAARDALAAAIEQKKANERFLASLGPAIISALTPVLQRIEASVAGMKVTVTPEIRVEPKIEVPPIKAPNVHIPPIQVPQPKVTVNVPEIKIPEIKMPNLENLIGAVRIMGWDKQLMDHPLPVQIRDADGKPVVFGTGGGAIISQSTMGGGGPMAIVEDIRKSGSSIIVDAESALRVTGTVTALVAGANNSSQLIDSSALPYSQANPLPIVNVGGAAGTSVSLVNADGNYYSSDNPLPVSASLSASAVQVQDGQASSITSHVSGDFKGLDVYILGSAQSVFADSLVTPDNRYKVDGSAVTQPISVTDIFATSVTSSVVTPDNRVKVDGSGVTQPVSGTVVVSSITASTAAVLTDSTGVQYSGSNPVPITWVSGAGNSTVVVGPVASDVAGADDAPIKVGGIARTANPTAVANGDVVTQTMDDLGRRITRPFQVRDLTLTAYATITTGIETTLLAASAGSFHDLVYLMASNESGAAVNIDIRCTTAGNVIASLTIPANSTAGFAPALPIPQDATGNNWTIDNDGTDVSNTTVNVTALFVREV